MTNDTSIIDFEDTQNESLSTDMPRISAFRFLLLSLITTTISVGICLSYSVDTAIITSLFSGFIFAVILSLSITTRPTWGRLISGIFLFGAGIISAHLVTFPFDRLYGHDNIDIFVSSIASVGRAAVTLLILRYLWSIKYTESEIAIIVTLGVLFTFPNAYYWIEIIGERSTHMIEFALGIVFWWAAASLGLLIADFKFYSNNFKKTGIAFILKAKRRNTAAVSSTLVGVALLAGSVLFYTPFETPCDKARYVIIDMDTQLENYQKAMDKLRAQYGALGFQYQFSLAVNEVLLDEDIAEVEGRFQELREKASLLSGETSIEQCGNFLNLKKKQAATQKEKFNVILKKLDNEAKSFMKR